MRTSKLPIAIAALFFVGLGAIGCTNQNGAGGTTDGTSAEGYELRSEEHLAPAMDSTAASMPEDTSAMHSTGSGE